MLAFVAWQQDDGALANVALDRAPADSRRYSMAKLLRRAPDSGAPPSMARLPMTPEEVAASYDAQEAGAAGSGEVADVPEAGLEHRPERTRGGRTRVSARRTTRRRPCR